MARSEKPASRENTFLLKPSRLRTTLTESAGGRRTAATSDASFSTDFLLIISVESFRLRTPAELTVLLHVLSAV
jgi:hypothetical protein